MAEPATFPEQRFLRALFPDESCRPCLDLLLEPRAEADWQELRRQIGTALDRLSYRERGILEMRYGLGDGYAYTLAESGYVFRLTRERIRQLQARSLRKLRESAAELWSFVAGLSSRGGRNGARRAKD